MEKEKNKVKKVKKNTVRYKTTEQEEIRNFLIVVLVVLICVGGVYLLTRAFVTKDLFTKEEEKAEEIVAGTVNYDVTIVGQMLSRPYDEYYVAIYDQEDGDYIIDMNKLVYSYEAKEKHLHIYTVDLSNIMNSDYYDPENENVNAKNLKEFKFGDITLIKVRKGKVSKYIVDYSKMEKELGIEE